MRGRRQLCSGSSHSRPQRELTVSATFRSSGHQRDRDADDRSQGSADIARRMCVSRWFSRAPAQSMPWPLGIEDQSNVCCPRRRTHAPDPKRSVKTFSAHHCRALRGSVDIGLRSDLGRAGTVTIGLLRGRSVAIHPTTNGGQHGANFRPTHSARLRRMAQGL